jgi:hypothetical protein
MSLKKTVAIVAAAGALAAISVPAMALENEFHGTYSFNSIFSNFQNGGFGNVSPAGKAENLQMNNYFEQRGRLQYIAKVSDDLKLVTHFELDSRFGTVTDNKYTNSTDAGGLETDGINLETKHLYLDFNLGKNFNTKLGLQPYKDTLKGIYIDADLPAIMTTTKLGAYTLGVGFSRYSESVTSINNASNVRIGDLAKDLFILDNTFTINKDTKAALSYYFLADYQTINKANLISTLGLSGETKVGPASLSGFVAMQAGHQKNGVATGANTYYHGWAANVAAKAAVGPGTLKTALLFTSGDNAEKAGSNKAWQSVGFTTTVASSYNESGMMIIARNTGDAPTSSDNRIRRIVTNLALLSFGYDANLTDKVFVNSNLGFGWTPASGLETGVLTKNSSDFMGTEVNVEAGYKVSSNLSLSARAAYMLLGGLYKDTATNGKDAENPYAMRLLAKFAF